MENIFHEAAKEERFDKVNDTFSKGSWDTSPSEHEESFVDEGEQRVTCFFVADVYKLRLDYPHAVEYYFPYLIKIHAQCWPRNLVELQYGCF